MRKLQLYISPLLAGFAAGAVSAALSLFFLVYGSWLITGANLHLSDPRSVLLTVMMILSAFLLYASMLLFRKLNGRLLGDVNEERKVRYPALFLIGASLSAVCAMLLAFALNGELAESLVMICYMIVCDMIVIIAFLLLVLIARWLLKLLGKEGTFLDKLKWQLPLSLLWFSAVYAGLLMV